MVHSLTTCGNKRRWEERKKPGDKEGEKEYKSDGRKETSERRVTRRRAGITERIISGFGLSFLCETHTQVSSCVRAPDSFSLSDKGAIE